MPQMNKGGKFIFGKSLIRDDLTIHFPTQALTEYNATAEGKDYLFTGSKVTGGFCVSRKGLLEPSKLGHILTDNPALQNYQTAEDEFVKYKGRSYCWINISENGVIQFNQQILDFLNLKIGMELFYEQLYSKMAFHSPIKKTCSVLQSTKQVSNATASTSSQFSIISFPLHLIIGTRSLSQMI